MKGDIRCVEGRLWRHDPQADDPDLETHVGTCLECDGIGCEEIERRVTHAKEVRAVAITGNSRGGLAS